MKHLKSILLWSIFFAALFAVFNNAQTEEESLALSYSEFVRDVNGGQIAAVHFHGDGFKVSGTRSDGTEFETTRPAWIPDDHLIQDLFANNVEVVASEPETDSVLVQVFLSLLPFLLMVGLLYLMLRSSQGGGGGRINPMNFGRSRARMVEVGKATTTFKDVAGCDEAKDELQEMVMYLQDAEKFRTLGGKIPKGVLMVGPPGTGKTLLARAVAGEAGVNFFTISGSDFVEMFVGVGASRVRDMFRDARRQAPCVLFIDEIDAVGRHRGAGYGGGHDEREQTLNQLLVEMDGFEENEEIVIIAATNRPDVLDPALLRPGRFDRQIVVSLPDVAGREQILKVHARKVKLDPKASLATIARGTVGFSGADLANLINESALIAARLSRALIGFADLEAARDKILMGAERKSMRMTDKDREITAYHEAGHAILGCVLEEHDPVYKVTIIPRGRALGVTTFLPEQDRWNHTRTSLMSRVCSLYGGRIAEEMIFGRESITTGASNDIKVATGLARDMVTKFGFSDEMGPVMYGEDDDNPFLGRQAGMRQATGSEDTQRRIDAAVHGIIDKMYAKAKTLLKKHEAALHAMAKDLLEYETLDEDEIKILVSGGTITRAAAPSDTESPTPPPASPQKSGTTETAKGTPVSKDPSMGAARSTDEDSTSTQP